MSIPTPPDLTRGRVTWTLARTFGTTLPGSRGTVLFEATTEAIPFSTATILPSPVETSVVAGVMAPVDLILSEPGVWTWRVTPRVGKVWPSFHIDVTGATNIATAVVSPGKGPIRLTPARLTITHVGDGAYAATTQFGTPVPVTAGPDGIYTIGD